MANLAGKMMAWGVLKQKLDEIEEEIKQEVFALGKTQSVDNVVATYSEGRGSYDYPTMAARLYNDHVWEDNEFINLKKKHSKTTVDWRGIVLEAPPEIATEEFNKMFYKPGTPSVRVHFNAKGEE